MRTGVRVSTGEQKRDLHLVVLDLDALEAADCEKTYTDTISGRPTTPTGSLWAGWSGSSWPEPGTAPSASEKWRITRLPVSGWGPRCCHGVMLRLCFPERPRPKLHCFEVGWMGVRRARSSSEALWECVAQDRERCGPPIPHQNQLVFDEGWGVLGGETGATVCSFFILTSRLVSG
mgnify:CR=1 FL=1